MNDKLVLNFKLFSQGMSFGSGRGEVLRDEEGKVLQLCNRLQVFVAFHFSKLF